MKDKKLVDIHDLIAFKIMVEEVEKMLFNFILNSQRISTNE